VFGHATDACPVPAGQTVEAVLRGPFSEHAESVGR
jgi:hypothetical protein